MYKIAIKDKEGNLLYLCDRNDLMTSIKAKSNGIVEFTLIRLNKHIKIGNKIEFFNKLNNDFSFEIREIIKIKNNIIYLKTLVNDYIYDENSKKTYLDILDNYKLKVRLNKLNKV